MAPTTPPKSTSHGCPGVVSDCADHKAPGRVSKYRVWDLYTPVSFANTRIEHGFQSLSACWPCWPRRRRSSCARISWSWSLFFILLSIELYLLNPAAWSGSSSPIPRQPSARSRWQEKCLFLCLRIDCLLNHILWAQVFWLWRLIGRVTCAGSSACL